MKMAADRSSDTSASRQALIVLGMHRSGTSAISGVLAALGAKAPNNLLPSAKDNPRGFWESAEVVCLHEQLLHESGSRWSDWGQFNPGWMGSASAEKFLDMVPALIEREYGDASLMLLKDPRMCRFVPFWLKAFDRMGIVPKFVIPVRHPAEVAASLAARNKFGRNRALLLWLRHMLDAESNTRGVHRVFVRYTDFLMDWRGQAKRIGADLDIKWPRWSSSVELEIDRFLTSGLRHQMASGMQVCSSEGLQEWVEKSYAMFELLAGGATASAAPLLDDVRNQFDRQSEIFASVVYEHAVLASEEIESKERERADLEQRFTSMEEEVARLHQEREEHERHISERERRIAVLEKEDEQGRAMRVELEELIAAREQESISARNREREMVSALTERMQELANQADEIGALKRIEQQVRDENKQLRADLAQCRYDLIAAIKGAERSKTMQSKAEQNLQKRTVELSRLTRILVQRDIELEEMTKDKKHILSKARDLEEKISVRNLDIEKYRRETIAITAMKNEEVAILQRELDLMRGSISWRMGAPLRISARMIRRILRRTPQSDEELLRRSDWFDAGWYLARYPDVAKEGVDPILHYINFGASEGRDPSPKFNTKRYLEQNADVAMSGANALVHYLKHGRQEGRKPC